jgi:hypothetical protein
MRAEPASSDSGELLGDEVFGLDVVRVVEEPMGRAL